ncbi:AraC family transcriptional regulator [Marinilabiliaceae bacterium JC017]|nr:AraC family transcriptional regulator [Marinilabiliaceae bacterium JC017]
MTKQALTQKDHQERINRVLQYIHANFCDYPDMQELASLFNYSVFHFHRIMRAYLGEPLGAYIQRIRLDQAAILLRLTNLPVQDIAFKVGYETPAALNKAFRKRFNDTPGEFRNQKRAWIPDINQPKKVRVMNNISKQPEFKVLPELKVVFCQMIGDYNQVAHIAWSKLCGYAGQNGLFLSDTQFFGISYDNPTITEPDKCRYDACITINRDIKPEGEIGVKTLCAGNYAVFTFVGPYAELRYGYDYIFGQWFETSGYEIVDSPCMEKYLNDPESTPPEELKTEIWIPVR